MFWVWVLNTSWAVDAEQRRTLFDALLLESTHHDREEATRLHLTLSNSLADGPTRQEVHYWWAFGRQEEGKTVDASDILLRSVRAGNCDRNCRILLEELEIERESIRATPSLWTFDRTDHGVFHPWTFQDRGSLTLTSGDDPSLLWTTRPTSTRSDRLVIGFAAPKPTPSELSFGVTATRRDGWLQVVAEDIDGRRYTAPESFHCAQSSPRRIRVRLAELVALDGKSPTSIQPDALWRVAIVDVQGAQHPTAQQWLVDNLAVR